MDDENECYPYKHKHHKKKKVDGGRFIVTTHKILEENNMNTYELRVTNAMWALEETVGAMDKSLTKNCPTLVHGSSGVRRTGSFVVLSMICRQLRTQRKMAILASAAYVRRHRFGVLRAPQHFSLVLVCALNFAGDMGLLDKTDAECKRTINHMTALGVPPRRTSKEKERVQRPHDSERKLRGRLRLGARRPV